MTFIVYMATNIVTGHRYVGITSRGLNYRKSSHCSKAKIKSASGGNCPKFHNAIRKYGKDAFVWEILEIHNSWDEMLQAEIKFILKLKPEYNIASGGKGLRGYKHNEESKRKISVALKGRKFDDVRRAQMRETSKKVNNELEYKTKMSNIKKGHKKSEAWKSKIADAMRGKKRPRTPEHTAKIVASFKATMERKRSAREMVH